MLTDLLGDLLHKDDHLTDGQMVCRSLITFLLAIALVRLSGRRAFGLHSPFDTVITLLLGATLSRGIVGASSFTGTLGACLTLAILHRLLAYICLHSPAIRQVVSGKAKTLYEDGHYDQSNMKAMLVSEKDLEEAVRQRSHEATLAHVEAIFIETNGKISVVKK